MRRPLYWIYRIVYIHFSYCHRNIHRVVTISFKPPCPTSMPQPGVYLHSLPLAELSLTCPRFIELKQIYVTDYKRKSRVRVVIGHRPGAKEAF